MHTNDVLNDSFLPKQERVTPMEAHSPGEIIELY